MGVLKRKARRDGRGFSMRTLDTLIVSPSSSRMQGVCDLAYHASYPPGFPAQGEAKVEAQKIIATKAFNEKVGAMSNDARDRGLKIGTCLLDYIMKVFSVFATEVCALGLTNTWSVVKIHVETQKYLYRLSRESYEEKGVDPRTGKDLGMELVWIQNQTLAPNFEHLFRTYPEWALYEEQRLKVAELQSQQVQPPKDSPRRAYAARGKGVDETQRDIHERPSSTRTWDQHLHTEIHNV